MNRWTHPTLTRRGQSKEGTFRVVADSHIDTIRVLTNAVGHALRPSLASFPAGVTDTSRTPDRWRERYGRRLWISDLLVLIWVVYGTQILWFGAGEAQVAMHEDGRISEFSYWMFSGVGAHSGHRVGVGCGDGAVDAVDVAHDWNLGSLDRPRSTARGHACPDELLADKVKQISWGLEAGNQHLVLAPSIVDIAGPRIHTRPVAGLPMIHVETLTFTRGQRVLTWGFHGGVF